MSNLFNASYCYLLLSIERVWSIHSEQSRREILKHPAKIIDSVLDPIASRLLRIPAAHNPDLVLAPCFQYFEFRKEGERFVGPHEELEALREDLIRSAPEETPEESVWQVLDSLEHL